MADPNADTDARTNAGADGSADSADIDGAMNAGVTVEVDFGTCIVSGMCASLAPEIFDIDDDGTQLEVLQAQVPPELADKAISAEACCPVSAIKVTSA